MEREWNGHKLFCECNDSTQNDGANEEFPPAGFGICPDCALFPWYYLDKTKEPHTSYRLTFTIDHPGDPAAGLSSFTDTVTVEVGSGDPSLGGGDMGNLAFERHMLDALRDWYDGAKVDRREG